MSVPGWVSVQEQAAARPVGLALWQWSGLASVAASGEMQAMRQGAVAERVAFPPASSAESGPV